MSVKSMITGDVITVEFTPDLFPTHVLAYYLQNRIDDYLNDPEPQEDVFCESIPKDYLQEMLTYIQAANKIVVEKNSED